MEMIIRNLRSFGLFVIAFIFFAIVSGDSSALAVDSVKIGVIYPFTGGSAAAGRGLRIGAQLAADIANNRIQYLNLEMAKSTGIKSLGGAKIKLIFRDHKGNPSLGADLAKKLIVEEKVHGILGSYQSSVTKTVSEVCEKYGVPMINGTSTSPGLTRRGYQWFWRTTPHDQSFTKDLFELLKGLTEGKVKGVRAVPKDKILTMASACENSEWGSYVSKLIISLSEKYGFKLNKSLLYSAKTNDLSSEVRSLKEVRPDIMLFASYTADAILMVKALKAQKVSPKIIWGQDAGFEKPEFISALGYDIEGVLTRTVFLPKIASIKKIAGQVNAIYKQRKRTGSDMGGAAARAFTAMQTWVYILEKAGSVKPDDIQKAANAIYIPGEKLIVPWAGIKFSDTGDEKGQNILGSGLIGQYQKRETGDLVLEIVYPFDMASVDMIFPFKGL
jgi:branched-chain amino acid transport system substrate-binding protein